MKNDEFFNDILKKIENPQWTKHKVHNWHRHIPDEIKKMWDTFSLQTKIVAFILADKEAQKENWDKYWD